MSTRSSQVINPAISNELWKMKGHKLQPLPLQCHSQHKKSHSVTAAECMNGTPTEGLGFFSLLQLNQQLWSHIYIQRTINAWLNYIAVHFRMWLLGCTETFCCHLHYVLKKEAVDNFEILYPSTWIYSLVIQNITTIFSSPW